MTRYTNIGIKRTYLEATRPDSDEHAHVEEVTPTVDSEEPAKKKQKGDKGGGIAVQARSAETSRNGSSNEPESSVKVDQADSGGNAGGSLANQRRRERRKKAKAVARESASGGDAGNRDVDASVPSERAAGVDGAVESGLSAIVTEKKRERRQKAKDFRAKLLSSQLRRHKRIDERAANTTCFKCRQTGHAVRDCPNGGGGYGKRGDTEQDMIGICYRCGSTQHTLSRCRKPVKADDPLPYAKCFVCSAQGHLASTCPKNKGKGIYPKGGACKVCGDNTHLAKDCILRKNDTGSDAMVFGMIDNRVGADEDDFHTLKRRKAEVEKDESVVRKGVSAAISERAQQGAWPSVKAKKVISF